MTHDQFLAVYLSLAAAVAALAFCLYLALTIRRKPEGTPLMIQIAQAVREGANAYLKRQYRGVSIVFGAVFAILILLAVLRMVPLPVPFAFLIGGFCSALTGYIGMSMATRSSARTTHAATRSLNAALRIAFSSGAVMGLVVVGIAVTYLVLGYLILSAIYGWGRLGDVTSVMLCFSMGASFYALFARAGGGIYTKGADVGADLVGKVEAGIPEDDPRNPGVIADNVGDNVGDVAGMGADLFESYVGSIVASMALAFSAGLGFGGVILPIVIAGAGIVASILGTLLVRTKEEASQKALLFALRRGVYSSSLLVAALGFFATWWLLGWSRVNLYFGALAGLLAGVLIGYSAEYFTSDNYRPTRSISKSSETGPATVIIEGLSAGMLSTAPAVIIIAVAIMLSFYLCGGAHNFGLGLYGVGIAGVGMLSTLGITLATDAYGPVADNAGGNAQMAGLPPEVRERTDALDSLGNTTAATGKGFAIGSAALTALALIVAYRDQAIQSGRSFSFSVMDPRVMAGLFVGAMLPFAFCSMVMRAIGRAAFNIVKEVRRQFREIKGLLEGKARPDYAKAVDICTATAQREMVVPSLMAIIAPILGGVLLGVEGTTGLLIGSLVSGFAIAIMMANSGGAWDNAKKYIERGNLGGKGSNQHKAAVVGDTVGDPFKDAAGPSLNILLKLMSIVAIVFLGFVLRVSIFR